MATDPIITKAHTFYNPTMENDQSPEQHHQDFDLHHQILDSVLNCGIRDLKRRIDGLSREEIDLTAEISEIEGKIRDIMLENRKLKMLVAEMEGICFKEFQEKMFVLMLEKEKLQDSVLKFECGRNWKKFEDEGRISGVCKLKHEIEVLEVMIARSTVALLDLQMMSDEIGGLKQAEDAVKQMEVRIGGLLEGLWELKPAIVEMKVKKTRELVASEKEEEENRLEKVEDNNRGKGLTMIGWNTVMVSIGIVIAASASAKLVLQNAKLKAKVVRFEEGCR